MRIEASEEKDTISTYETEYNGRMLPVNVLGISSDSKYLQSIDVASLSKDEIIISVRDTGIGFNPLLQDPELSYSFSNAEVLKSIASQIKYDLVLGMNDTRIHLNRVSHQETS